VASAEFEPLGVLTEESVQVEYLGFFQERMATAYQEQTWAVALVGGMNAFVASHASRLLKAFKHWFLQVAVGVVSLFALGFVWSRHFIFMHYDDSVKALLALDAAGSLCSPDKVPESLSLMARWSGVTLYSLIIFGLYTVAARMIAKSQPENGA
jgi:hypothetical protein